MIDKDIKDIYLSEEEKLLFQKIIEDYFERSFKMSKFFYSLDLEQEQ